MATDKKSPVVICEVEYTDDGPKVLHGTVKVSGIVTKDSQTKNPTKTKVELTLDYAGKMVADLMETASKADWIRLQKVRDRDDFVTVAGELNGSVVHVDDIDTWTDTGKGRLNQVAAFLMRTGKYTREQAEEVSKDPIRKQKVLDWMASLEAPSF